MFLNKLVFRSEILTSVLSGMIVFCGQAVFWSAVFREKEIVGGFTYLEMIIYILFTGIVSEIADSKIGFTLSEAVLSGEISNILLKPMKTEFWLLAKEYGGILFQLFVKVIVYIPLFIILFGFVNISLIDFVAFLFVCSLSFLVSFFTYYFVAVQTFWTENNKAMTYTLRRIILFISGGLIPLGLFPESVRRIINVLPFRYIIGFPVDVLLGRLSVSNIALGILQQVAWILILWFLSRSLFMFSVRKNESVGI